MPESVTDVYKWVVDDVIQKVEELFVQEGVEQSVLNELREMWLKKLQDSGVMGDPNQEPPPQPSLQGNDHGSRTQNRPRPPNGRRIPENQTRISTATRPQHGNSLPHHIGVSTGVPSFDGGLRQIALGVPRSNLRTPMALPQEYVPGLVPPGFHISWPQTHVSYYSPVQGAQLSVLGGLQGARPPGVPSIPASSLPTTLTSIAAQPGAAIPAVPAVPAVLQQAPPSNGYHQPGMQGMVVAEQQQALLNASAHVSGTRAAMSRPVRSVQQGGQLLYSMAPKISAKRKAVEAATTTAPVKILKLEGNNSSTRGHIPQQDGANDEPDDDKEEVSKPPENPDPQVTGGGNVDDPLGSEDDPSLSDDDDEEEEVWDSPNFLTAQYEKVSRNKTRWRCSLKFGIFHANGQDFLFKTANGEFEF